MGLAEKIIEAIIAIFIIFVFAVFVFPALGQATGQSVILPIIILVLLAVIVIIGIAIAIIKFFQG